MGKQKVTLSGHAVDRYRERLQRPCTRRQARYELEQMLPVAEVHAEAPGWANRLRSDVDYYLVLGGVAFVVRNGTAVTCLVEGEIHPERRQRRREHRREERRRKSRDRGL